MLSSSSNLKNTETEVPATEQEWEVTGRVPDKPPTGEYGYVVKGEAIGCTREELLAVIQTRAAEIKFVWTPETPAPVFPEKVPLLLDSFRKTALKRARSSILWGVVLVALGVVLAFVFHDWRFLYRNILSMFGALALIEGVWQLARLKRYAMEDAAADGGSLRFDSWINKKHISGYTFFLGAFIVIVGLAQMVAGDVESIKIAGLVKPAVWQGQVWRLFTACLMHVSFLHFWMNLLALLAFARIAEQTIQRACVPLVFLVSGVCGSLFSVVLYPHTTSVGASGGLMGLLGFITMAASFNRTKYPPKYLRNLIEAIVFVGVWGLMGLAFIDNAAHLGGLCGGVLMGWALLRPFDRHFKKQRFDRLLTALGVVALLLLGLVAATAVLKMIR
jgi:membrane associated rhomboid family serine protease